MTKIGEAPKPLAPLLIVLVMQIALLFSVFLNIPVARQVIGFLYLTFIPGFIILKLFYVGELDITKIVLFSIGFSIAFLMLLGLLVNQFGAFLGLSKPLSITPIIGSISVVVLIGAIISYFKAKLNVSSPIIYKIELKNFLFFILPALSIAGALLVAITGVNSLLLLTIILVAMLIGVSILCIKCVPRKYYVFVIFAVSLTMVFYSSLATTYIQGFDIHPEYNVFTTTQKQAYWNSSAPIETSLDRFSDMLSITILPTIYSNILNMDATWILKLIFPLMLSFIPLGVFKLWQKKWGDKTALISALLVIVQVTFYTEMLGLAREIVAELFLVLLLLAWFDKNMSSKTRNFCLILFGLGMIVSHYGIALIFSFIIFGSWLLGLVGRKKFGKITWSYVVLFFVMMFSWYLFTRSGATLDSIFNFGAFILERLGQFFNISSRGPEVSLGLGVGLLESAESNLQLLGRFFAYATQFLIMIGFVSFIRKWKKTNVDWEYFLLLLLGTTLLLMTILLPGFATTLAMTRWLHIALLLIAPFFVLGCKQLISLLRKKNMKRNKQLVSILIVAVLVPYFLFQTNFVYEVAGVSSWSVPLSGYRMDKVRLYGWAGYVDGQSIFGVQWLSQNAYLNDAGTKLYADVASSNVLRGYGGILRMASWTNISKPAVGDLLYLSSLSVKFGIVLYPYSLSDGWNSSELSPQLQFMDKIYSNEGSEIWLNSLIAPTE
jgi:uncharacterized membrane protein